MQMSCGSFEKLIENLCGWSTDNIGTECCEIKLEVETSCHDKDCGLYTKENGKLLKCFKLGALEGLG